MERVWWLQMPFSLAGELSTLTTNSISWI